jgi:inner membrane protein
MEPVTHILTGACLSRAGLNRRAAHATLTMAIAAEFPDIDTLWGLRGPVAAFQHHRGITHTFVALPVEAAIVVGAVYILHRIFAKRTVGTDAPRPKSAPPAPLRWGLLYGFALIALLSHLLLDYSNNYGLRPFFPFNPQWYAGSFVFIFDPLIFLLLAMAFLMPPLFALINSEVGARRQRFRGRGWAIASLVCIALVWGLRATEHARAVLLASAQSVALPQPDTASTAPETVVPETTAPETTAPTQFSQPLRVLANPDPINPFRWHIVSDFGGFYQLAEVNLLNNSLTPAQDIHVKPARTPALVAAEASPLGRVYMDWSPMPFLTVSPPGDPARPPADAQDDPGAASATIVTFRDPRFMLDLPFLRSHPNPPLTGTVELGPQLQVLRQTMNGKVQH